MKYHTVKIYLDARIEFELAGVSRRPSLVGADELARLGEIAFPGSDAAKYQSAIDSIAQAAAMDTTGASRSSDPSLDLEIDRALTPTATKAMREYAGTRAGLIVKRAVTAEEKRGPWTTYRGVWKSDAEYNRGDMATHNGTLWHCEGERVVGRPGASPGWKLMHKSLEKAAR